MSIAIRERDGVTIIETKGNITLQNGDELLRNTFLRLLRGGVRKVILNLAGTEYLDSAGLGHIVCGRNLLEEVRGEFAVVASTPRVKHLFKITSMAKLMKIFADEDDALLNFS